MNGRVTDELEATLPVRIGSAGSALHPFVGVIDTGFNGYVTAPQEVVTSLGLSVCGDTVAELGDGSEVHLPTYEAEVEWFGRRMGVPLLASEGGILLGMSLLRGCRLQVEVESGGEVSLVPR